MAQARITAFSHNDILDRDLEERVENDDWAGCEGLHALMANAWLHSLEHLKGNLRRGRLT